MEPTDHHFQFASRIPLAHLAAMLAYRLEGAQSFNQRMTLQQELLRRVVRSRREVNLYSPDKLTHVLVWAAEHGHLELVHDMMLSGANPRLRCTSFGLNAYDAVRFIPRRIQTLEELQRRDQITKLLRGPRQLLALVAEEILYNMAEHIGSFDGRILGAHIHRLEIPLELKRRLCNYVPAPPPPPPPCRTQSSWVDRR